jgi:hypothetical protein
VRLHIHGQCHITLHVNDADKQSQHGEHEQDWFLPDLAYSFAEGGVCNVPRC